jgi:D-arabinose 1-dehydrogenase-like Zn-dependent alcohol dehydrogenase
MKIAKLLGAHVTCTDRIDAKLERARGLGADWGAMSGPPIT